MECCSLTPEIVLEALNFDEREDEIITFFDNKFWLNTRLFEDNGGSIEEFLKDRATERRHAKTDFEKGSPSSNDYNAYVKLKDEIEK